MKTYRVIQYGAGNTGKFALQSILTHPRLELVALLVHGPAKEGQDAGTLCRLPETGIRATRDVEAAVRMAADCVCFMPSDPHAGDVSESGSHAHDLLALICRFLASGKNVIATAPNSLVYAKSLGVEVVDRLNRACAAGRSSFLYVGVSPGFMPDRLVLNFTAVSSRIDHILVQEMMNYGAYDDKEMLFGFYGFGCRPAAFDSAPMRQAFRRSLGGSVAMIADGLAIELDEVSEEIEFAVTAESFAIRTGQIAAGTIAAERIRLSGLVAGVPRIVVEHVTRVSDDVAPDWPHFGTKGGEGYHIEIRGAPAICADVELGAFGRNPMADAGWAVGGHIANSIADLSEAAPGIRSFLDMPPAFGRHRMR
jgi:hypothetical protein